MRNTANIRTPDQSRPGSPARRERRGALAWMAALALGLVLLLSACSSGAPTTLTASDAGKTVQITQGQQFIITLDNTRADSGYDWVIDHTDSALLMLVGKTTQAISSGSSGGGVRDSFTFNALQDGTVNLQLKLAASSGSAPVLQRYAVTIQITSSS